MLKRIVLILFFLNPLLLYSQPVPKSWLTYYERSGYTKTPRYGETMEYCRRLEKASPWISVTSFGRSPEGRDLPLVIASKDRAFTPGTASKTGKAILLIQNGIHSGEIDGKDACLMLLRDIAITKKKASLLDHVILVIIPIYNVDGHERFGKFNRINQNGPEEMGWRVTAQNLNLNRDYVKADAPETQAWLRLFNSWMPDFFIDAHVTDGADFQHVLTYSIEMHENVAQPVRSWIKEKYVPSVIPKLTHDGVTAIPYIFLRDEKAPTKGIYGGTAPPRFSTIYSTLHNRPGLLIETHMMKDYRSRVDATYRMIAGTIELLNKEYRSLREAITNADNQTAQQLENPFPLTFDVVDVPNETVRYMGFKQKNEQSEISNKNRVIYSKEPFEADVPRYDSVKVVKSVAPPVAYLIPPQWQEVIARLKLHGVKLERLKGPLETEVESYRFADAKWQEHPFEGRHPVRYTTTVVKEKRIFSKGTIVVRMNQRAARVALHTLEPDAPDAFAAWGFFDAVFEQKEYAEDYVMETMAREMLATDATLNREFESKLQSDSSFARDPSARLNFFYQRSPYWDTQMNVYPVARLVQNISLSTEPIK